MPGFAWAEPPQNNFIDEHVFAKLKKLADCTGRAVSATTSSSAAFISIRSAFCRPRAEVEAFVADASPEKRNQLIDRLLARPEFAERMAQRWADLLRVKAGRLGTPAAHKLHRWLVEAMERNMPYDELVRTLLTAEGSTLANPPASFFRAAADTNDCAEATAQLFLAARIQCAKCHNHPFDRWSQDQYYALGAFFARVQRKTTSQDGELIVFAGPTGETTQPRTGKVVAPGIPAGGPLPLAGQPDRRAALAQWLTAPGNRHFARVGVIIGVSPRRRACARRRRKGRRRWPSQGKE